MTRVTPNPRVNTDAQAAGFSPLLERRLRALRWAPQERFQVHYFGQGVL